MSDERVLCVPSIYVDAVERLIESDEDKLLMLLDHTEYIPRSQCETDERYRQLLPYVITRCNGLILAYQRKGTETRLDGLWSIGIGGHVNDEDEGWIGGMIREIREETGFGGPVGLTGARDGFWAPLSGPLGFLRDDSNPVGRVHLGVLYTLDVPRITDALSDELRNWRWGNLSSVEELNLENWSRMALEKLKGGA